MGSPRSSAGLRHLQTLFTAGTVGALSDGELLARYVSRRDELAFEALVERHGPMVFQVCRSALSDSHDAQDAFQATFLVLARRAASIRQGGSVASWLFGVAGRVAARARVSAARRRKHESSAAALAARLDDGLNPPWRDSEQERHELDRAAALHEELARLPQKYREPVVLCGDQYEETNEFATEDMKHVRGKTFAFHYKLDGDKWFLKGGPDLEIAVDDLWMRVK